jgi:hypothetical protein
MTAKQKANQARFKKVVAEAKKLRKKNPKLTQAQAVKQAWAMTYTKKKVAGYSEERNKIHKEATKWIKHNKKRKPDISKKDLIRTSYDQAAFGPAPKVGAIKKKSAPKKKAAKKSSSYHKDTKSHNVNIRVMSGVKRDSGYIGRSVIKKFTLSELKKLNPIYFEKGKDKAYGVYARKLMLSNKLQSQVMIEAQKQYFGNDVFRSYVVRLISPSGEIDVAKRFETLFGAADYIGKNIVL